jgi:tetratricopeptide (TPR) repeat protein
VVRNLRLIVLVTSILSLTAPASAQSARASGVVRDTDGRPIKGATIRAVHPDVERQVFATSDSRGRWAMIGLRVGTYTFIVDAPGFVPVKGTAALRTAPSSPLTFTLAREPGLTPGALPSTIQAQITAANALRDQGRIDQAIRAYEDLRSRHSSLTTLNLVLAASYRQKAGAESDPAVRRAALERAIECYGEMLKADPENNYAKAELAATRAEAAAANPNR